MDKPRRIPHKYQKSLNLTSMLAYMYKPCPPILYYEVLSMPITEIENKKNLKILWQNAKTERGVSYHWTPCYDFIAILITRLFSSDSLLLNIRNPSLSLYQRIAL